jgi:translation initiation factor 2B subunit (eIF-2B alpha/beta/delta family)
MLPQPRGVYIVSWHRQQEAIMTDKVSGATTLVVATAALLEAFASDMQGQAREAWVEALQEIATSILVAQSGMASLVQLFNRVFMAIDSEQDSEMALAAARTAARSMADAQDEAREAICKQAIALLPQRTVVFTHSASSTVLRTILLACETGREPEVICTESRPMNEGRAFASQLATQGVPVTLVVDAGMYLNLQDAGIVFVGGDSLTEHGVVSKLGTAGLAVCSQSLSVPFYVLADITKIWPSTLGDQPIHQRAPGDVWEKAPEAVQIRNAFYDLTPWSAISGIVTQQGVQTVRDIRRASLRQQVHPSMRRIIAEVRSSV